MGHHPSDTLLAACAAQALRRVEEASLQNLASTLWGFAKLRHHPGDALLQAFQDAAVKNSQQLDHRTVVRADVHTH